MGIAALDRSDSPYRRAASTIRELLNEAVLPSLSLVNYAETLVRPAEDETLIVTGRRWLESTWDSPGGANARHCRGRRATPSAWR
jgi:hypothetical protein